MTNAVAKRGTLNDPYRPPVKPPTVPPVFQASKLISYIPFGRTSDDGVLRTIGNAEMGPRYHDSIIDNRVIPALSAGCRRFLIGNPGGVALGKQMEWTQLLAARKEGMGWLADNLPYFVARCKVYPSVEVIGYIGAIPGDSILGSPRDTKEFWKHILAMNDAVAPLLDAGMSIACDGAGGYWPDSTAYSQLTLMRKCGANIYVEPYAGKLDGQELPQKTWPSITEENFYRTLQATNTSTPIGRVTGEVIRLIAHPVPVGISTWEDPSWVVPCCKDIIRAGHTVCIGADYLMDKKISFADVTNP